MAALLPAEILLLTLSFEPQQVDAGRDWLAALIRNSAVMPRVVIAMAGTFVLIVSAQGPAAMASLGRDRREYPWEWTVVHAVCFLGLYELTDSLFRSAGAAASRGLAAAWILLCLGVAATWCLAMAPARACVDFLAEHRKSLLASLAVGVAVWLFGLLTQLFWRPLADGTLLFAYGILREVYPGVEFDPVAGRLGTSRLLIEIAPQCSGYEGIALVVVFVAVYLWLFRGRVRMPGALWLFPAGIAAIWVANVMRIAALVVVGTEISPGIAAQGFHSQAGWLAFTVIALGLIGVSHRTGLVASDDGEVPRTASTAPAHLVPLMALLLASMLSAAFSAGFDALYPVGVVATAIALYRYRAVYRTLPFDISGVSVGIGALVYLFWILLTPAGAGRDASVAIPPDLAAPLAYLWIVARVVGSVVTVPIAEELAFRGYLIRKLVDADFERVPARRFTWLSFAGSSLLFGLMHDSWVAGTMAGAAFAVAVYHRGRTTDAIVAHATANALVAASVAGFGWWHLWL